jgi:hypothetical protein
LLFSDVAALSEVEPTWIDQLTKLNEIRESFRTPEYINDGYETKPSKRLENLLKPPYKKTRHGPLAAKQITISVMERECEHFRLWIEKLRKLSKTSRMTA